MNRRKFLRITALGTVGAAIVTSISFTGKDSTSVAFVVDPKDIITTADSSLWALNRLRKELKSKGISTRVVSNLSGVKPVDRCVIISNSFAKIASDILKTKNISINSAHESIILTEGEVNNLPVLLISGNDSRGLVYGLLELADRLQFSKSPLLELRTPEPVLEKPANGVRGIYKCFTSEIEDKKWFYDRKQWKGYLTMLAAQRFNRFSLALGMGYNTTKYLTSNYFLFPYPFLLDVPGYNVRVDNLLDSERERNLDTLKFISEETVKRSLRFQLALWWQGYKGMESNKVNYPISGVNEQNHGLYCRDALTALLKTCPEISGVTFRVHGESGVPEGKYDFWKTLFETFKNCGRKVDIDMHAKNITQEMINVALGTGMNVTLSPKYWAEHQGMGYIQTAIREREMAKGEYVEQPVGVGLGSRKFTRYGYGDYLREDRPYGIVHRFWPGTQRLLLSGDPVLTSAYGRISGFCGSNGFEIYDPLTFKGRQGSGHSGSRTSYADKSLIPKYDWEKFLYTYRLWGRLTYNPDTSPEVWRRFLRAKFKDAAKAVEEAISNATRVLTSITTALSGSPDCKVYWPEIYLNSPIVDLEPEKHKKNPKSDNTFGSVSPFDPQLFYKINDYAATLIKGKHDHKYTPIEVAVYLENLAVSTLESLKIAREKIPDKSSDSYRRFAADVKIQAGLAQFFAAKVRAAVLWKIFDLTGGVNALTGAVDKYRQARDVWKQFATNAKEIYTSDISFGRNINIRGDWMERLQDIDIDLIIMEKKIEEVKSSDGTKDNSKIINAAIQEALSTPKRIFVKCDHILPKNFERGKAIEIKLSVPKDINEIILYYRHVNQALHWQKMSMIAKGNSYYAEVPAEYTKTNYPMQYYFGLNTKNGKTIYPGLDENFMNQPYYIVPLKMKIKEQPFKN